MKIISWFIVDMIIDFDKMINLHVIESNCIRNTYKKFKRTD